MKLALVIGSGSDIIGRNLQTQIDNSDDMLIVRINKYYGDEKDIGKNTDMIFVCDGVTIPDWLSKATVINPHHLYNELFLLSVRDRINHIHPSTGILAIYWLLDNGYKPVVIGFGFKNGILINAIKTYTTGQQDTGGGWHNFALENEKLIELHLKGHILLL